MRKVSKKRPVAKPRKKPTPQAPAVIAEVQSEETASLGVGAPIGDLPEETREVMRHNFEQLEQLAAIEPTPAEPESPMALSATSPVPLRIGRAAAVKRWFASLFIGPKR